MTTTAPVAPSASSAVSPPTISAAPDTRSAHFAAWRGAVSGMLANWRYTGGKRDLRIDFLRGFAVLAMVADHLGGEPSWLYNLTGGNKFLFSAAEAFVFISGLVMGIVYCGIVAKSGIGTAMWKAMRRAGALYMLTIILSFGFISLSYLFHLPWVAGVQIDDPIARLIERLTLHRAFYLTDVLLLYTLLVGIAPLAFLLIANKRTPYLLLGSWTLWLLFQRWPDQVSVPWNIEDNSVFHFASWQVLFFTGLVVGYHRERIAGWVRRIPLLPYFSVLTVLCAGLIWFHRHSAQLLAPIAPDGNADVLLERLFSKADVRIGRLIAFAVFFQFAIVLATIAWKPLTRALGWLLLPLGQSALLAYSTHLFVIAFFTRYVPRIPGYTNTSALTNTVVQLAGIGIIYAVIRLTPAFKTATASAYQTIITHVVPSRQALAVSQPSRVMERRGH